MFTRHTIKGVTRRSRGSSNEGARGNKGAGQKFHVIIKYDVSFHGKSKHSSSFQSKSGPLVYKVALTREGWRFLFFDTHISSSSCCRTVRLSPSSTLSFHSFSSPMLAAHSGSAPSLSTYSLCLRSWCFHIESYSCARAVAGWSGC